MLVGEVPLDLRHEDHVARAESELGASKALLVILMQQAGHENLAAKGNGELEILAHGHALDRQVDGVGVVVEPNVALANLVLAGCVEENESKARRLGNEGEVRSTRGGTVPALGVSGGGDEHERENDQ